jgi:hypothetical protein
MRSGENRSVVVRWCAISLGGGLPVVVGVWVWKRAVRRRGRSRGWSLVIDLCSGGLWARWRPWLPGG